MTPLRQRRQPSQEEQPWFISDRAIDDADDDRLDHQSVAAVVVEAVRSARPPCMVGLLAEFGRGKSSTANIAVHSLNRLPEFDAVRVTADKHSGNTRARNIVHAIAAELECYDRIEAATVAEILRPLRQATQVAALDPTDTPASRFLTGRYDLKKLFLSIWVFLAVAVGIGVGALIAGAPLATLLTILATSPLFIWVAAMTFGRPDSPIASVLKPATVTDQTPRAEAADEIEEVFGRLVDYHYERRKRRLVVFVDDIDRLSKDDLLDALRALRSLQSVPRGREPIFVIACHERIVQSAVSNSADSPADGDGSEPLEPQAPERPARTAPPSVESEHSHPALAFIDKLLTVRVPLPPALRGDMRRFALETIPPDHPLRSIPGVGDIEKLLAVLIHDGVRDPRSVIRLLNRFFAAVLLGRERENQGRVYVGDITHHLDVLAQLTVIADEFPEFYDEIASNTILLPAATKAAQGIRTLTPSEGDALDRSAFTQAPDDEPTHWYVKDQALSRYLAASALRVHYPIDLGPLVYFTATPGGRALGVDLRNRLLSALDSGSADELAVALDAVPSDRRADAAQEIADTVREASYVDTGNYLAAVAPNLGSIEEADSVADACAELLDRTPDEMPPVAAMTALLDHVPPGRDEALCARLTRHEREVVDTNERYVAIAAYAVDHPRVDAHLRSAVLDWLRNLPEQGGWDLVRSWLPVAEHMRPADHRDLLAATVEAAIDMVRTESGFSLDDADQLVSLAERLDEKPAGPPAEQLTEAGPNTMTAFTRLWTIGNHEGSPTDAWLAATTAANTGLYTADRLRALQLIGQWVGTWAEATVATEEDEEEQPAADRVIGFLAEATAEPEMQDPIANLLPQLAEVTGESAAPLANAVLQVVARYRSEGQIAMAEELANPLVRAVDSIPSQLGSTVNSLLEPISTEANPESETAQMALRFITPIAGLTNGLAQLSAVADSWSTRLRGGGEHDDRCALVGFQQLARAARAVTDEKAPPIAQSMEQLLAANDDIPGRLRTLAMYPWPADNIAAALTAIHQRWDQVPGDARLDALKLANRAPDGFNLSGAFHDRIVEAVLDGRFSEASAVAARELPRMSASHRAKIFMSGVNAQHPAITGTWSEASEDEAASVLADYAGDDSAVVTLVEALPAERRAQVAGQGLLRMSSAQDVGADIADAAAGFCTPEGLSQALEAALERAAETGGMDPLRVAAAAVRAGAHADETKVSGLVIQLLPDGSAELGEVLGELAGNSPLSGEAEDTLKKLRKEKSAAVNAFDTRRRR